MKKEREYKKPFLLHDKHIAIISPSHEDVDPIEFEKGVRNLKNLGFRVLEGRYIYRIYPQTEEGYKLRASLINWLFAKKDVGAMICETGGFGAKHVLEFLHNKTIRKNPKMICGYSDDTSLLMYLNSKLGLVVFHGPSLAGGLARLDKLTKEYFLKIFSKEQYPIKIRLKSFQSWKRGKTTGKVIGGNLTVLLEYLSLHPKTNFKGKILFLEEFEEPVDNINQMLYELKKNKILDQVKGILLGRFMGSNEEEIEEIKKSLLGNIKNRKIPVLYGFKSGHGYGKIILPFGIDVTIDSIKNEVTYDEFPFKR
jgi:muramoyltetrapeptide carboxypeptidase